MLMSRLYRIIMSENSGVRPMEDPNGHLEQAFIDEYLRLQGHEPEAVRLLPPDQAKRCSDRVDVCRGELAEFVPGSLRARDPGVTICSTAPAFAALSDRRRRGADPVVAETLGQGRGRQAVTRRVSKP